jgi:hypothetical protein
MPGKRKKKGFGVRSKARVGPRKKRRMVDDHLKDNKVREKLLV